MQIERRSTPEARAAALAAKKAAEAEAEARRIAAAQVRSHRSPISGCTAFVSFSSWARPPVPPVIACSTYILGKGTNVCSDTRSHHHHCLVQAKLEELNARIAAKEAEKKAEEERKAAEQAAAARAKAEADAAEAAMKAADEEAEAAKAAAAAKAEAEASAKRQPPQPPPPPPQQQQQQPPVKPAPSPPPTVNAWAKPLSLGPVPAHARASQPTAPQALPAQGEPAEASRPHSAAEGPEAHASAVLETATPADPPPNAWTSR